MKHFLLLILPIGSLTAYSQDTTRTPTGYEIDFQNLHVKIDTVHNHTTIAHYYHKKAYVSVNGGKAILMKRGRYLTAWSIHPLIVVTRKNFKQSYQL
jgi:hypothetical protein